MWRKVSAKVSVTLLTLRQMAGMLTWQIQANLVARFSQHPQSLPVTGFDRHTLPAIYMNSPAQGLGCPSLCTPATLDICFFYLLLSWLLYLVALAVLSLHSSGSCPLWTLPDVPDVPACTRYFTNNKLSPPAHVEQSCSSSFIFPPFSLAVFLFILFLISETGFYSAT